MGVLETGVLVIGCYCAPKVMNYLTTAPTGLSSGSSLDRIRSYLSQIKVIVKESLGWTETTYSLLNLIFVNSWIGVLGCAYLISISPGFFIQAELLEQILDIILICGVFLAITSSAGLSRYLLATGLESYTPRFSHFIAFE